MTMMLNCRHETINCILKDDGPKMAMRLKKYESDVEHQWTSSFKITYQLANYKQHNAIASPAATCNFKESYQERVYTLKQTKMLFLDYHDWIVTETSYGFLWDYWLLPISQTTCTMLYWRHYQLGHTLKHTLLKTNSALVTRWIVQKT